MFYVDLNKDIPLESAESSIPTRDFQLSKRRFFSSLVVTFTLDSIDFQCSATHSRHGDDRFGVRRLGRSVDSNGFDREQWRVERRSKIFVRLDSQDDFFSSSSNEQNGFEMIHHNDVAQSIPEAPLPAAWEGQRTIDRTANVQLCFLFQHEKTRPDELIMSIIIRARQLGIGLIRAGSISSAHRSP